MNSYGVTIQMKATEQYFPVVLLIMPYKVVLAFESVDEILSVTIQMKATEQYFPVVLLIMPYKVVLAFESVDEILSVTIQMKATEQHFSVVLFIMLHFFFYGRSLSLFIYFSRYHNCNISTGVFNIESEILNAWKVKSLYFSNSSKVDPVKQ